VSGTPQTILVVDDEPDLRLALRTVLERAGYRVSEAVDGRDALRVFHRMPASLVVLDVSMPELDGWQVVSRLREISDVPVLMLTASGAEAERVRGLRSGADDYVVKPFGNQELAARVGALLRRSRRPAEVALPVYEDAEVRVDVARRSVERLGKPVSLTPRELSLLTAFVSHPGQLLSHEQLLKLAWADAGEVTRSQVKLYVKYLRDKMGWTAADSPIEAVRGFGYRYRAAGSSSVLAS
jgi:DNA-binding response OmpR family regulator